MKITNKSKGTITILGIISKPITLSKGKSIIFSNSELLPNHDRVLRNVIKKIKFDYNIETTEEETEAKRLELSTSVPGGKVSLSYDLLEDKPESSKDDIDDAVSKSHTHTNKSVLDQLTESEGKLQFKGVNVDSTVDLSNYATNEKVTQLISGISVPSIDGLITEQRVTELLSTKLNSEDLNESTLKAKLDAHYITNEQMTSAIQQAQLSSSGSSVDLGNYLTISSASSQYLSKTAYESDKATFLTDESLTDEKLKEKLNISGKTLVTSDNLSGYATSDSLTADFIKSKLSIDSSKTIATTDQIPSHQSNDIDPDFIRSNNLGLGNSIKIFSRGKAVGVFDSDFVNPYYRIPSMLTTKDGTIIIVSDYRSNATDQVAINIVGAVSNNGGKDWSYVKVAERLGNPTEKDDYSRVMDSTLIETKSGKVICFAGAWKSGTENWTSSNGTTSSNYSFVISKTDSSSDYKVWTQSILSIQNKPSDVRAIIGGIGTGIIHSSGDLIVPIQYTKSPNTVFGGLIYSEDDGETWKWSSLENSGISENNILELPNGDILCIARVDGSNNFRRVLTASDYKSGSYTEFSKLTNKLPVNTGVGCQGSSILVKSRNKVDYILTTIPQNRKGRYNRDRITVYAIPLDFSEIIPIINVNYDTGGLESSRTWRSPKGVDINYNISANTPFGGYSVLSYSNNSDGERLSIVFEDNLGIRLTDLTPLLPHIENTILSSKKRSITSSNDKLEVLLKMGNISGNVINCTGKWGNLTLNNPRGEIVPDPSNEGFIVFHNTNKNAGSTNTSYAQLILNSVHHRPKQMSISFDIIIDTQSSDYDNWNQIITLSTTSDGNDPHIGLGYKNDSGNLVLNPTNGGSGIDKIVNTNVSYGTKVHLDYIVDNDRSSKLYVNGSLVRTDNFGFFSGSEYTRLVIGNDVQYRKKCKFSIGNLIIREGLIDPTIVKSNLKLYDVEPISVSSLIENSNLKSSLINTLFSSSELPEGNLTQLSYFNNLNSGSYIINSNRNGIPSGVTSGILLVIGNVNRMLVLSDLNDQTKLYIKTVTKTQINEWKSISLASI